MPEGRGRSGNPSCPVVRSPAEMTFLQGSARRCQLEITDRRFCPGSWSGTESRVQALSQEIVLISSCKLSTLNPREDVRGLAHQLISLMSDRLSLKMWPCPRDLSSHSISDHPFSFSLLPFFFFPFKHSCLKREDWLPLGENRSQRPQGTTVLCLRSVKSSPCHHVGPCYISAGGIRNRETNK